MHYISYVEPILRALGQRVKTERAARGLTQHELATAAGLSVRFLGQIEKGEGNPSVVNLLHLADALATTTDQLLRSPKRLIALVGLRGAGKSTVGTRLAKKLGLPFVELDREVERVAAMSLAEIFDLHGESRFRQLELEALRALATSAATAKGAVIATGGGIVNQPETWSWLREHAVTVWLKAAAEDHLARVEAQGDRRPMAGRADALSDLRRLLASREPLYGEAEIQVDTSDRAPAEIASEVRTRIAG